MTSERWERIKQITGDALDLELARREAFVAAACADDAELRAEVEALLEAEDPTGRFLEPDPPPDRIGAYRIVREIGRGGMGTVYEGARADAQFEQRVAIKVVSVGGKMFAVVYTEPPHFLSFKCSPEDFAELVERDGIRPAPYLARAMWVQEEALGETLDRREMEALLRRAYELVRAKLPKRLQPGASRSTASRGARRSRR